MTEVSARRSVAPDVKGLRASERTLELLRDLVLRTRGCSTTTRGSIFCDRLAPLALDRGSIRSSTTTTSSKYDRRRRRMGEGD